MRARPLFNLTTLEPAYLKFLRERVQAIKALQQGASVVENQTPLRFAA